MDPYASPHPRRGVVALASVCLGVLIGAGAGCDRGASETPPPRAPTAETARAEPSAWRRIDESLQVAVPADAADAALAEAISQARRTAPEARLRWLRQPPVSRGGWSINWRAPTADGGAEYVWVEPLRWSAFRVEGRLANPPQRALECGRTLNETVSFPIEELADWMHVPEDSSAPREGGFTVDVLEGEYGRGGTRQ